MGILGPAKRLKAIGKHVADVSKKFAGETIVVDGNVWGTAGVETCHALGAVQHGDATSACRDVPLRDEESAQASLP
jgi:hypothetical protein